MAGSSKNADPEGEPEYHYKAAILNAFNNCCIQPSVFIIYTMDGGKLPVSRDLLLLFSPLLRDLFESLPSHPSRSDSTPVIVLPDFDSNSVIRLMKLISAGEAGGFRNSMEGKDVLNLSKNLQVGIDILHKDGSPTRSRRSKTPLSFPKPIEVKTAATIIKKETENEVSNENQQEKGQFEDMQVKEKEMGKEKETLETSTSQKQGRDLNFLRSPVSVEANESVTCSKRPNSVMQEDQVSKLQFLSSKKMRKASSDNNCNYELRCEVCLQEFKMFNHLGAHMVKHFVKDVEELVIDLLNEKNECKLCGDSFKHKCYLISHLGRKHGFINNVLRKKNLSVLPCAVHNSYSASKQETIARIKKERDEKNSEENDSNDDLRREIMMECGQPHLPRD